MDPQNLAAMQLQRALNARHMSAAVATRSDGYSVIVDSNPSATVHFGYGNLRELVISFVFDGRRPQWLNTVDTEEIADLVVETIAGNN